jgi:soluble lytic murein transglycosylase-like protein
VIRPAPIALSLLALAPLAPPAFAGDTDCFHSAAQRHQVDQDLLLAIAKVESNFDARAVHYNRDGTRDVGVMQINSRHFDRLQAQSVTEDTLLNRPCRNVEVGAEILAGFVQKFGPTWRAVGAYSAGTRPQNEPARQAYAARVAAALARLHKRSSQTAGTSPGTPTPRLQVVD